MLYCQKVADRCGRRIGVAERGKDCNPGPRPTPGQENLPKLETTSPKWTKTVVLTPQISAFPLKLTTGLLLLESNSRKFRRVAGRETDNHYERKDGHNLAHLGRKCLQLPGALDQHFPEFPITALWERKCLGLHGVPGLHFPECPRRTTSTAPPTGGGSACEYSQRLSSVSQNAEGERCPRSCLPGAKVLAVIGSAWTTLPTVP